MADELYITEFFLNSIQMFLNDLGIRLMWEKFRRLLPELDQQGPIWKSRARFWNGLNQENSTFCCHKHCHVFEIGDPVPDT